MPEVEYVPKAAFDGRCKLEDERFARDKARLDDLERLSKAMSETSIKMGQILVTMTKEQTEHGTRISAMEQKPAKRWDSVVDKLLMLVLSGAVAWMLVKVGLSA